LSLLAADVIGNGGGCGNGCYGKGGSGDDGALRYFSRVMFKILHILSNIFSIKLDEEGGEHNGCGDGSDNEGNNGNDEQQRRRWQRQQWLQRQW
jgi:hypothetical protein